MKSIKCQKTDEGDVVKCLVLFNQKSKTQRKASNISHLNPANFLAFLLQTLQR